MVKQHWARNRVSLTALAVGASMIAGQAWAATAEAAADDTALRELVVTAEPRSQNLQTAPIAAQVLTADTLDRQSIDSVDDLEFSTPSLTVSSSGQGNTMNIRGIGKNSIAGNTTSAVATYRDGIGTVSGFFNGEPYYDVSTIEVLRGPQGTFVGQNAAGGAIFVNTRDPSLSGVEGFVEGGYGNFNTLEALGAFSFPINDTLAVRVAFRHAERDSFFHVFTDAAMLNPHPQKELGSQDFNSARIGVLWKPSDNFTAKLKVDLNDLDNHGYVFGVVAGYPLAGANISSNPFIVGNNYLDNYARDRFVRAGLDLKYVFDGGISVRSLTGAQYINTYIRNDDDGSLAATASQHIRAIFRMYSEEVQILSPSDQRFRWIAGAYANIETLYFPENDGFVGTTSNVPTIQILWRTPRITEAVFGQVSYDITEQLEIQGGLRFNHYDVKQDTIVGLPALVCPPAGGALCKTSGHKENKWTGKLALNFKANEDHFLYVFVAQGLTTGGVNLIPGIPDYDPSMNIDYEAGWKATWADGAVRTQLGAFYTVIQDYQINYRDATTNRSAYQNIRENSHVAGIEATAQGHFEDLSIDFGLSWLDSVLGEALVNDVGFGGIHNTKGNPMPYAPSYTVRVGVQYDFHVFGGLLSPRADYSYTAGQTITATDRFLNGVPIDRIVPHHLINAQITYTNGPWRVTGYMTNADDLKYIESHGGGGSNAYPNEPQRYGVRIHRDF